jgi:uncharacterized membrane protein YbhN (UPF0104 family)
MSEKIKQYGSIFLAVLLVVVSIKVFDVEHSIMMLTAFSGTYLAASLVLAILIYLFSGLQFNALLKSLGIRFSLFDTIMFPITMNLWSLLVPLQGALIFSTIFFARKYGRTVSSSLSISLFLYLVTASLTGLFGLIFMTYTSRKDIITVIALLTIALSPLIILLLDGVLRWILPFFKVVHPLILKLSSFIATTVVALKDLMQDWKLLVHVVLLKTLQTFLVGVWYWVIARGLGFQLNFLVLLLLSLVGELAIIIKVTPANLGVSELVSGALLAALGYNPQWGVLISLTASATTLLLIFTLGLYGNHMFMKVYGIESIRQLINNFRKS